MISCNDIEKALARELDSRSALESFPLASLFLSMKSALKSSGKEDDRRIEHQTEIILRDDQAYFISGDNVFSRQNFFRGAEFKIVPTALELEKNVLIAGARFCPFCSPELFSDDYELALPDGKTAGFTDIHAAFSELAPIYLLMGRSLMIDCLYAESDENLLALRNAIRPESAQMQVTAFDMGSFYRDCGFQRGDALIVTVKSWSDCQFDVRHLPKSEFASLNERELWISSFEKAMLNVVEQEKDYQEMPEQTALAFLTAFENGEDLRKNTAVALEEYQYDMREIAIRSDGPDWLFVSADDVADAGADAGERHDDDDKDGHHHDHHTCSCGHERGQEDQDGCAETESGIRAEQFGISGGTIESMEAILSELGSPLDNIELYAMTIDAIANNVNYDSFEAAAKDRLALKFADDAQETAFRNFLEEQYEVCTEMFVPNNDEPKAPLRARLLDLSDQRVELSKALLERGRIPAKLKDAIKANHRMVLETLALLNSDSALPAGEEYDQLELRVSDIEDAWEEIQDMADR